MRLFTVATVSTLLSLLIAAPALAAPEIYVVNFRHADDSKSQQLEKQIPAVIKMTNIEAEEVIIDTTTAAKWTKGAHDAFNRDIVPVFNKWVGLPGFAAVVDAKSKTLLGCLSPAEDPSLLANELRNMAHKSRGEAFVSAATSTTLTQCPETFNAPPAP
jgi:hypothetical protein